jgi:uncharacterized tellurite resistance protein B-like protein
VNASASDFRIAYDGRARVDRAQIESVRVEPRSQENPVDKDLSHRVCRLIAGLVVSDDDLDEAEDAFVDRLLEHFGIPLAERDTIFPIVDRSEAADAVKSLPPDVQKEALTLLVAAASADGKIVAEERAFLHTVAEAMGVSIAEIDKRLDDSVKK